jgi:ABC-type nickel/cobalt efflux system permease component RcnA
MKRNFTGNQRGEIVTGVMVVMMVAMMIFGGMSMMHGGHRHADDQDMKAEDKHDHQKEGMHEKHNHNTEDSSGQDGEAKDHMRCM